MFIKYTKKTTYYCADPLRMALPQSPKASRLLFLREPTLAFNTLLPTRQKGVLLVPLFAKGEEGQDRVPIDLLPRLWRGRDIGRLHEARQGRTWYRNRSNNGQNLIEYTIVIALVSAAMVAMSTYVFRSAQATQKVVEEEFRNE